MDASSPSSPSARPTAVVLHHELPDGSSHFDLMLLLSRGPSVEAAERGEAPDDSDIPDLVSFRCSGRPDELREGQRLALERLQPHRRHYLQHEGAVSGGRGNVRRVAAGDLLAASVDDHVGTLELRWRESAVAVRWSMRREVSTRWILIREPGGWP